MMRRRSWQPDLRSRWQRWRLPKGARLQLAWMDEMERVEQEVFPDARPRSEVRVRFPQDGDPED